MKIQMHDREVELLQSFLAETRNYFEFGVGGSTCLASKLVKNKIFGIDSDQRWIDEVWAATGNDSRITLRHVDIGKTGGWGTPVSRAAEEKFPFYSRAILDFPGTEFDFCLVDGRFRVACFLQALQALPDGAVVAMHDYFSRPQYHVVEKYARPIASCLQLTMFVRREDVDANQMRAEIEAHQLDWA